MSFVTRARVKRTSYGHTKTYRSRCGKYKVVLSTITLGKSNRYAPRWFAIMNTPNGDRLISRHRTQAAAERACIQHERKIA